MRCSSRRYYADDFPIPVIVHGIIQDECVRDLLRIWQLGHRCSNFLLVNQLVQF